MNWIKKRVKMSSHSYYEVYIFDILLTKLSIHRQNPMIKHDGIVFSLVNNKLMIDGEYVGIGLHTIKQYSLLVIKSENVHDFYFTLRSDIVLTIGKDDYNVIKIEEDIHILINNTHVCIVTQNDVLYYQNKLVQENMYPIMDNMQMMTKSFRLEKTNNQWHIILFSNKVVCRDDAIYRQPHISYKQSDFPKYYRHVNIHFDKPHQRFVLKSKDSKKSKQLSHAKSFIIPFLTTISTSLFGNVSIVLVGLFLNMLILISQYVYNRYKNKKYIEQENKNKEKDFMYAASCIAQSYQKEREILQQNFPFPSELVRLMSVYDTRIYERAYYHDYFLTVSLGLGSVSSKLSIDIQNDEDKLLKKRFSRHERSPISLSLKESYVGVVGTYQNMMCFLEHILIQLTFFHSYLDVQFVCLISKDEYNKIWRKWRFLKHFYINDCCMRGLWYQEEHRQKGLDALYNVLLKRKDKLKKGHVFLPHYLFIVTDYKYIIEHPIYHLLEKYPNQLGMTVIFISISKLMLPHIVKETILLHTEEKGQVLSAQYDSHFFLYPPTQHIENGIRCLSNLIHIDTKKPMMSTSLNFLEQYQISQVSELSILHRWQTAKSYQSLKVTIGISDKNNRVYWDLHESEHGAHALIAGMTGSGKSQFLITYLLSLAVSYSPEDISMFIIDWKGGEIVYALEKLPHIVGVVTNLDENHVLRAIQSLKAEIKKRQEAFVYYRVFNLNEYIKRYKAHKQCTSVSTMEPLPHLFLICDEFAELKTYAPEFLIELTSIARIGRSLGIHLILATQKPSGIINEQMESNIQSKIVLKVNSEQDSNELLKTPDAAYITTRGRGYLKIGQKSQILFQSGYTGCSNMTKQDIALTIYKIDDLGQSINVLPTVQTTKAMTQLEAIISEIVYVHKMSSFKKVQKVLIPPLEESILMPILQHHTMPDMCAPLGIIDLPFYQKQEIYFFNVWQQSHTIVFGSKGYGKTSTILTMILSLTMYHSPEWLYIYMVDFDYYHLSAFLDLPHVLEYVSYDEQEKLNQMIQHIYSIFTQRKKMKHMKKYPTILIFIDDYDSSMSCEKLEECLYQVIKEGAAFSIYVIMTVSTMNNVRMALLNMFRTKIVLHLKEKQDALYLLGKSTLIPKAIKGRGYIIQEEPILCQIYTVENICERIEYIYQYWCKHHITKKLESVYQH
ncbi:type VII secretion protein EssC [Granulicatella sp. zg-84]|nr:type VII secretion protein EssC [Granulicatella sp. zg-84]